MPGALDSGLHKLIGALAKAIDKLPNTEVLSSTIYGSSNGQTLPKVGKTQTAKTDATVAKEQAEEMVKAALSGKRNEEGSVYRLLLVGHSWGADKTARFVDPRPRRTIFNAAILAIPEFSLSPGPLGRWPRANMGGYKG